MILWQALILYGHVAFEGMCQRQSVNFKDGTGSILLT